MRCARRLTFSRVGNERGAIAVVVALLMVVFLGFAAISIDVGRLYVERRQLQNGADAAALLIAQDCARLLIPSTCAELTPKPPSPTLADGIASKNANDGYANAKVLSSITNTLGVSSVTVQTSTLQPDGATKLPFFFAPALNNPGSDDPNLKSKTVSATSTASWGAPRAAAASLPIAINLCRVLPTVGLNGVAEIAGFLNNSIGAPNGLLGLLRPTEPTVLRYDADANKALSAAQSLDLAALLRNPTTLVSQLNNTLTGLLCGTEAAVSQLTNTLPLPTRSADGGFVFLKPDNAPDGNGCQVVIGDLLTNILSKKTTVFGPRKLPSACAVNGNLDALLNKPFTIPIYALAGNPNDLLTPGNIVPTDLLSNLLKGIGSGNVVNGVSCDLSGLVSPLNRIFDLLSGVLGFIPFLGSVVNGIVSSVINPIINREVPKCTPPQPDWVQIVAFAGFNMTGYNLDVEGGGRTSGGDFSKCSADPCRGIIGNWTQVVSLNPLNLGPLSAGLTARLGAPTNVDLSASLGHTLNLGVNAVVLSK